jgi:hypothetical protein
MDDHNKLAITAIGDPQSEGFIAASLERQGWRVIYRALTAIELREYLDSLENIEVTLLISNDFAPGGVFNMQTCTANVCEIRIFQIPANDHDLSEIIRGSTKEVTHHWATLPSIPILSFTSFGRSVGTSTIALNIASELAMIGARVLLIDAHLRSSFLSPYLQIFGVNREVMRSPFGFSIFEANNPESFSKLEQEITRQENAQYEILLIDIGEVWQPNKAISGRRAEDYAFAWAAHFSTEMISVSSAQARALSESRHSLRELEELAMKPKISHLINFSQSYSPKERSIQQERVEQELGRRPIFLPQDDRAVLRAKAASSTLAESAPKSALRAEIARYCRDSNWSSR